MFFLGLYDDEIPVSNNIDEIGSDIVKINTNKGKRKKTNIKGFFSNLKMPILLNKILITILSVLIILVIFYSIYLILQPSILETEITPNPTFITTETTAQLKLTIKNTTDLTLKNISIQTKAIDDTSIVITPSDNINIPILGKGESRNLIYKLTLLDNAKPGIYIINIKVITPAKVYTKQLKWEIKNP